MNFEELHFRKLCTNDYQYGYLELLNELSPFDYNKIDYNNFYNHFCKVPDNHEIYVLYNGNELVASGTLLIESKFIHGLSYVSHIEDIVVKSTYRGKGIGKYLITKLLDISKKIGCYKAILNCSKINVNFYEKCGLQMKEVEMVKYFD